MKSIVEVRNGAPDESTRGPRTVQWIAGGQYVSVCNGWGPSQVRRTLLDHGCSYVSSIARAVRSCGILTALFVGLWLPLSTVKGEAAEPPQFSFEPGEIALHIIAFSGPRVADITEGQELHITELPNAEFPIQFSRVLLGDPSASLGFHEVPRKLGFRDIWTVNLGKPGDSKPDWIRRKNAFSNLDYRVRLPEKTGEPLELELKGSCRGLWKGTLRFELPTRSSVLIETPAKGDQSFFFVLTALPAIPLEFDVQGEHSATGIKLKSESHVVPNYPREFLRHGLGGTVGLWYYILADGRTDLTRLIFISCPHPAMAQSVATAVRQWRYVTNSGQPPGKEFSSSTATNFEIRR